MAGLALTLILHTDAVRKTPCGALALNLGSAILIRRSDIRHDPTLPATLALEGSLSLMPRLWAALLKGLAHPVAS